MAINEVQRQTYLDAMGIDSYMPRWILSAAPLPHACQPVPSEQEVPVAPVAPQAAASDSATAPTVEATQPEAGSQSASALLAVVEPSPEPSGPVASTIAVEPSAPSSASPAASLLASLETEVPRFALSLWRVNQELLVIDSRHAELALPTEPLLINMLAALGYGRTPLPAAEVVRWPMVDNRHTAQGPKEARETLAAMVESMLESQPASHMLLLGDEACRYLAPLEGQEMTADFGSEAFYLQRLGKTLSMPALAVTAVILPSLSDLLQRPELKRDAWLALQPLRRG